MAKMTKAEKMVFIAIAAKNGDTSGNPLPPATFPPSERVFYRGTTSGNLRITTGGDGRVTTESAT
jgi:hypothetical protein